MSKLKLMIVVGLTLISSQSFAQKTGNGGDICADRILSIAADLEGWIIRGGADRLTLPANLSLEKYKQVMTTAFHQTKVSCTNKVVKVGKSERTCKNYVDRHHVKRMLCNRTTFEHETSESDQYMLIHHEYAGSAGIEKDLSPETSDFSISHQMSEDLEAQWSLKLAVKGASAKVCPEGYNYSVAYGCTPVVGSFTLSSLIPQSVTIASVCSTIALTISSTGETINGTGTSGACTESLTGTETNGLVKLDTFVLTAPAYHASCSYQGTFLVNNNVITGNLSLTGGSGSGNYSQNCPSTLILGGTKAN